MILVKDAKEVLLKIDWTKDYKEVLKVVGKWRAPGTCSM